MYNRGYADIIIIVILIYLIKTQNIKMGRLKLLIYGSITYVCCLEPLGDSTKRKRVRNDIIYLLLFVTRIDEKRH